MKLAGILIISFILIGLIGSASTSYFLYLNSKDILKQSVYKDLESNSRLIKNNIDSFLEAQKEKVKLISTQEELTPEELTALLQLDSSFWGLFVINSEGIITLSSNKEQEGLNSSEQCYFISAKNQTSLCPVYFVQVPKEYSIPVSTPFHGGVLVGLIKLETLEKIASDKTGLGQTGENLLAFLDDQDRIHYITSRRFSSGEDIQIPKGQLSNTPIYYSLEGKEEFFTNVKDYRNISVIASTKYLNEIQVGMVSKVDEKEVLGAAKIRFLKSSIILGGIITLLVSAGGFFISSQISKPLKDLTSNVKDITQGEFSIKLNKSRIYEVQVLTDSLNRILSSLKLAILRAGLSKREFGIGEAVKAKKKAEEILKKRNLKNKGYLIPSLQESSIKIRKTDLLKSIKHLLR